VTSDPGHFQNGSELQWGGLSEADAAYAFLSIFDTLDAKADLLGQTPKKLDMFDIATAEESAGQVEVEVCYSFPRLFHSESI
jgi:hypothetical protein